MLSAPAIDLGAFGKLRLSVEFRRDLHHGRTVHLTVQV